MLFLLIAFAGFLDASYLAAKYFLGSPVICNLLKGCEIVTSSKYSVMFGIPIALMGSLYYLALLILTVVFFDTGRSVFLKAAAYGTVFGFIASLYFVYLQFFQGFLNMDHFQSPRLPVTKVCIGQESL